MDRRHDREQAFKVDPRAYQTVATVTGLVGPYTYSDMTGVALKQRVMPQWGARFRTARAAEAW